MSKPDIIPIFSSHYGLLDSILTFDITKEMKGGEPIKETAPVSIFAIAQTHKLDKVFVFDSSITGFWEAYKNAKELGIQLVFGYKVTLCADHLDKSEDSLSTESNFVIVFKNSQAYYDAVPIITEAQTNGFYHKPRLGYQYLDDHWSENFLGVVPFYSSPVARNLTRFNHAAVPVYKNINPYFLRQKQGLPWDDLIESHLDKYCGINKFSIIGAHWIYFYKTEDILAFNVFKCIGKRSTLEKPELGPFSSDQFSFESFLERMGE